VLEPGITSHDRRRRACAAAQQQLSIGIQDVFPDPTQGIDLFSDNTLAIVGNQCRVPVRIGHENTLPVWIEGELSIPNPAGKPGAYTLLAVVVLVVEFGAGTVVTRVSKWAEYS
jgi:hypothetical protein